MVNIKGIVHYFTMFVLKDGAINADNNGDILPSKGEHYHKNQRKQMVFIKSYVDLLNYHFKNFLFKLVVQIKLPRQGFTEYVSMNSFLGASAAFLPCPVCAGMWLHDRAELCACAALCTAQ